MTRTFARKRLRIGAGLRLACSPLRPAATNPSIPTARSGPIPTLPEPHQYLFPPMHLAPVVGWKEGETPTVAPGLKIEALATGLQHPRSLYVLPNGDVLVVQSNGAGPIRSRGPRTGHGLDRSRWVTSGGDTGPSNRITLLRDANGDGKPETQTVFLDHLNSPFGVALVGNDLYVANTDAIMHYTYHTGDTKITGPGTVLDATSRRPDRPSLDQEPGGEPGWLAALCRRRLEQQHHRERHRGGDEPRRHLGGGSGDRPLADFRKRLAQSERPELGAGERRSVGRRQRTRRARSRSRARLHDVREGWRLLRLALQLLRPASRSAGPAAAARIWSRRRSFRTMR